jgi:hypothetical protein
MSAGGRMRELAVREEGEDVLDEFERNVLEVRHVDGEADLVATCNQLEWWVGLCVISRRRECLLAMHTIYQIGF